MATQPDHVNSGALATILALGALATVATALAVTALVRTEQGEIGSVREEPLSRAYRSLRAEQERTLTAPPAWVDRGEGLVSIPIDRAMELTLKDVRRGRTVVGARKPDETEEIEEEVSPEDEGDTPDEGAEEPEGVAPEETPGQIPTNAPGNPPTSPPGNPSGNGQDSGSSAPQGSPSPGAPVQGTQSSGASQPQEGSGQ